MKHFSIESHERLVNKLIQDLGHPIREGLLNPDVQEIQLNANGSLWFNLSSGNQYQGDIQPAQGYAIIFGVAGLNQRVVTESVPVFNGELPHHSIFQGERFTAQIPPVTRGPSFTLRKRSAKVWTLADYVETERMTQMQANQLKWFIAHRKNIVVCGGPNSGKTTVTNALIADMVEQHPHQRLIILEDTAELRCVAPNYESLLTSEHVSMTRLLRQTMRLSPDRILVGEVTGGEALDLLKAWNTGCPGGLATIHANGPLEAIQRLQDLAMEAGLLHPPVSLVKHTIDVVVFVRLKNGQKGFIESIHSFGEN